MEKSPEVVLDFYNKRRKNVENSVPNDGHKYLAELEKYFDVTIFIQNIDDLHERAGSTKVFHLHGDIKKARSWKNEDFIIDIGFNDIKIGDVCEIDGEQLRPYVVFFGEFVNFELEAEMSTKEADILIIVETSLMVYPAAQFHTLRKSDSPLYIIDPDEVYRESFIKNPMLHIKEPALVGMKQLYNILIENK